MRDIIDLLTKLNESTGLANRKPGDVFKNAQGNEIVFDSLEFYPQEGGKYTPEELDQVLQNIETQESNINWQNERTARTGGFGIAKFTSGTRVFFIGRFLNEVKPNKTDNYVPNTIGEYKFGGKAAEKAQAGLSPQDLLQDKIDLRADDILTQLASSLGKNNPLYKVALQVARGDTFPITFSAPPGVSFTAFRDYFCEILQPIALQRGMYSGNAGEAAEIFLGGSFDGTLISFDDSKTAGLSDSIISTPDGAYVKISTKGGRGAYASAKNLLDSVSELDQTELGRKLALRHPDIIDMLRQIKDAGQVGAPLMLGVKYKIITADEAETIRRFKNLPPVNLDNLSGLKLTANLKKLALKRKTDNPEQVNLFYHLLAGVAHDAAEAVNTRTDFSEVAAKILNNGALVQVYTKAKENQGEWSILDFNTVYPGTSIKGVYLTASKTYYSTGINGNYTFKIAKNSEEAKEPNQDPGAGITNKTGTELSKAAQKITTQKATKPKPRPTADVGRQKRKK